MPIKKAAKKYMRVTARKNAKNLKIKGLFKRAFKKTNEAIAKKDLPKAQEWFKKTAKFLDKASEKNVLHRNTAARKKSRLNKKIKALAGK